MQLELPGTTQLLPTFTIPCEEQQSKPFHSLTHRDTIEIPERTKQKVVSKQAAFLELSW